MHADCSSHLPKSHALNLSNLKAAIWIEVVKSTFLGALKAEAVVAEVA